MDLVVETNQWKVQVQSIEKYQNNKPPLHNCFWHNTKRISKKFNKNIAEKKKKLTKEQKQGKGNLQYELVYPQIKELEITGNTVRNHFYRAQKLFPENVEGMTEEFLNFTTFFDDLVE